MKNRHFIIFLILLSFVIIPLQGVHALEKRDVAVPIIWNLPSISKNVIDRGGYIGKIRNNLKLTNRNEVGIFYLSGATGIGKTFIAQTYANKYRGKYDIVYFFNGKMNLSEQLKKLNFELNFLKKDPSMKVLVWENSEDEEKIVYYTREFLRTTKLRWLIIVDNIDGETKTTEFIPDHVQTESGHVIFTSQAHQTDDDANAVPLPSDEASIRFMTQELTARKEPKDKIVELAKILKNYPIALNHAAAYLKKNTSITIEDYIKLLNTEENLNPLKISEKAVLASVENIKKVNAHSWKLLNIVSCMHSKNIPGSLLKNWFLNYLNVSHHDFTQAVELATSYSLITPIKKNSEFYETHDFIQETIYKTLSNEEKIELNKSLVSAIRSEFMKESKDIINPVFSEIIDHAKTAYERGLNENRMSDEFLSLLIDIIEHNNTFRRDFSSSYSYIVQISPIFKSNKINNREIKSRFYLTAARFFWRLGKTKECEQYLSEAEKYTKPQDIEEFNRLKIYQADLQTEISNLGKAEEYLHELEDHALKYGYAKKEGSSAYYYLMVLHHMAQADYLNLKGDFRAALNQINLGIQKATDYYQNKTGNEPPLSVMAPLYNTRNFSLVMLKDQSISSEKMLKLIKEMKNTFKSDQHRFVSVANVLYSMIIESHDPNSVHHLLQTSLEDLNQWFQGNNVNKDQILAHVVLGNYYSKGNKLDKALSHLTTSLELSKSVFKDLRNTYVHETLHGLTIVYLKKKELFEAQTIYNLHKEIFSEQDPRTKKLFDMILNHYSMEEKV